MQGVADHVSTGPGVAEVLAHREIVEQVEHPRTTVEAGVLGQVAESASDLDPVGLVTGVEAVDQQRTLIEGENGAQGP